MTATPSAAGTPGQRWRQVSQQASEQARRGDWHAYACSLQVLGDQLYQEGNGIEAIDIYCRVLLVQINGPVDGAPFTGTGLVNQRVYERMLEFAGVAGLDDAGLRAKFIDAAARLQRAPLPLGPAKAWTAISAQRAQRAVEERLQREARDAARSAAQADEGDAARTI